MKPEFSLTETSFNTSYAPLCVVGYHLWQRESLKTLRDFSAIPMQSRTHTPGEKLLDALLVILAGYPSLHLLTSKLAADPLLATAWHRKQFAHHSTVSRTLDACPPAGLTALQQVSWDFWRAHTPFAHHDWRKRLVLDLDLTPLPASRHAAASTKGHFAKKTSPGGNWPA